MAETWKCPFCGTTFSAKFLTCTCPGMCKHLAVINDMAGR